MRKFIHRKKTEVTQMAYYQDQYGRWVFQPDIQTQVQPPMDRLAQLQAQQKTVAQPPQTNQGLLWVQGENAARSYLVAPNSTVLLMDSDASRFYLKSADNVGMPSLKIFEYSEVVQNAPQATQSTQTNLDDKYVTREEYSRLQAQYAEILDKLDSFHAPAVVSEDSRKSAAATNKSRGKGGDSNGQSDI